MTFDPMPVIGINLQDKRSPRKVTFLGNFGKRNLGNEGTLAAILYNLRQHLPEVEVNCVCTDPEVVATTHKISAVPIHEIFVKTELLQSSPFARLLRKVVIGIPTELYRWIKAVRVLRRTDILIVPGTQLLSDSLTGPWGWPYMVFRWSIAAKLRKSKLLFVSVGVGPLEHPLSRFFVKFALLLANFRSYRDDSSRQYLRSIGFDRSGDWVYPDLAFSLPIPAVPLGRQSENEAPIIAVGVLDYHGQFNRSPVHPASDDTYRCYIERMAGFVFWLLEHVYTVRLVIGDASYDPQTLADLRKALEARGIRYEDPRLIAEPTESVEELITQLATSDFVVSPRFHNIVFGLLVNRPVMALSYHEKFSALLESANLARFNVPIDHADANMIIDNFRELLRNPDELKREISRKVEEYRSKLAEQYSCIFGFFNANNTPTHF